MEEIIAEVSVDPDKTVEADQTEEAAVESPAPTEDSVPTEGQPDNALKSSKDFSPEERATIIAMAKEVGFVKVANEFGIKARLISYWVQQEKRKAARPTKPSKALKLSKALKPSKALMPSKAKVKGRRSSRTLVKEPEHITDTPAVAAVPTEPVKVIEPAERKAERTVSAKPAGSAQPVGSAKLPERSEALIDRQSLIIENAILKERISALNAEIEKLRAALTSLM